jgi:hypothetical protein
VTFDWAGLERTLTDGAAAHIRSILAEHPDEHWYAAAFDRVYRETDGVVGLPNLGVTTVEAVADTPVHGWWNPADWEHYEDCWLDEEQWRYWGLALTDEACRSTVRHWEATFRRYLTTLVRVCKGTRKALRDKGSTGPDFVVLFLDDEHHDELIRRVLAPRELARVFPALDGKAAEYARVDALPPADRAAYHASRLVAWEPGPVDAEQAEAALRALGTVAFPALTPLLDKRGHAWRAAKLLAEIGQPDDAVIAALDRALARHKGPDRMWVAIALARLGRLDLVLDRADRLPDDVVVSAVAGPYTSFRDHAVSAAPLDYRPLEDVLERRPGYGPALAEELRPGRGYCEIRAGEVDEAVRGLGSRHVVVRRHAVSVLGDRTLGAAVGRRVLPLLVERVSRDPDAAVRRIAIVSLMFWRRASLGYADVIRTATQDPDATVRAAAEHWFLEQNVT